MKSIRLAATLILLLVGFHRVSAKEALVWLVLQEPCIFELEQADAASGRPKPAGIPESGAVRRARLEVDQAALEPAINALGGTVTAHMVVLENAVQILIPPERLADARALPGVVDVKPAHRHRRLTETSVPFIHAPAVWLPSGGGYTGEGVRIGIIDSGIDYLHADFGGSGKPEDYLANNSRVIEPGTFPTAKVVGGTDLVGDNYDAEGVDGSQTPSPDPDPLDPAADGHGTHVAGIAAGVGVLTNGTAFAGPYNVTLDMTRFQIGPGVAPQARLYAIKVFGSEGSTGVLPSGLDYAADPNRNGSTSDHLDVVNLSLGSAFGVEDATDLEQMAIARLTQLGCVVVAAAGNSGNTRYNIWSPGVAPKAITVANSIDSGASFSQIKITAPEAIAGDYASAEGAFTLPLTAAGITAPVVYGDPHPGCSSFKNAAALQNKIALIDRGACYFVDKIRNAQAAGAVGVIVVNNVDGPPIPMAGVDDTSDITIPGVMITLNDGELIKSQLANGVTATLAAFAAVGYPELADQLEQSSSRGPSAHTSNLKPDLAAPGTSITSARAGFGFEGIAYTGTSMACPHVTGAAALLRQAHADWTVEDIKAALMNTAVRTRDSLANPYPESRTGAGRLEVAAAARTMMNAKADDGSGMVSLSFGVLELNSHYTTTRDLRVINHGDSAVQLKVAVSNTVSETGVTLTPLSSQLTVPAHGSTAFAVRFDADPAQFDRKDEPTSNAQIGDQPRQNFFEASGGVWFLGADISLHVPWYAAVRAVGEQATGATLVGVPPENSSVIPLPTRGLSAHGAPLVSVFQLGATSPTAGFTDRRGIADLLAVGAATDVASAGSLSQATLYFGLAVAGAWDSPQRIFNAFDIEIDRNGDGSPDYTLLDGSANGLIAEDIEDPDWMTDALITVVRKESDQSLSVGGTWNVLDPAFRDMAPFHNRVLIHSAPAAALGLTPANSKFRYRAVTFSRDPGNADQTSWAEFDAARPVVDATSFGLNHSPIFDEGASVKIRLDRANAIAAGFSTVNPPKALLLHQHNVAIQQVEVVTLNLGTGDVDGDGLPDVWELAAFGDLASDGTADHDRDGLSDAAEFLAGTDPTDPDSVLQLLPPLAAGAPLRWTSVAGHSYTLERSGTLNGGFKPVQSGLLATPPLNAFTDTSATGPGPYFYRVRLQ